MTDPTVSRELLARVALLEEALVDYAVRYGLTERARALLVAQPVPDPSRGSVPESAGLAPPAEGSTG